jgi:microcystin degradation protein MlrC
LHGAWLGASYPSADAELVRRIRTVTGNTLPIVVTLDSHANVTPALLSQVDGVVGYRTYPHVDMAECGRKAARLLLDLLTQGIKTCMYWLPIPLLAPPQSATTEKPPLRDVLNRLDSELPDEVLSSSLFYVQPWLDMPGVNSCLLVVARSQNAGIDTTLQSIAQDLWDRRAEFHMEWVTPERLVGEVLREPLGPVIVSEAFDGTSGGAPGDNPGLLSILLPAQQKVSACVHIVDPAAAERAFQAGIGGTYDGPIGANQDTRFGCPLNLKARVRHLSDGEFVLKGPVFTGRKVSMGPTAVLEAGKIQVVVGSRAVFTIDPELYRSQGIEPAAMDVVAVKSPTLFRPGYASMLKRVLHLDMPGVCRGNLRKVPFEHLDRPIYPLDEFEWKAVDHEVTCFRRRNVDPH